MNSITYIGMDVHTTNYTLCAFTLQTQTPFFELQIRPEFEELKKYLTNLDQIQGGGSHFVCGYEAGCLGYSLYKEIMFHNWKGFSVECVIMAPSTMASSPNDKLQKSDSIDARWIARCLCFGQYKRVFVPTEEDEAVKEYIRMRDDTQTMLKQTKQQIIAFCTRHGLAYDGKAYWTEKHLDWLEHLTFFNALFQETLREYLLTYQKLSENLERYDKRIEELSQGERYEENASKLCCFKGIATHTAMSLLSEVGDFNRFPSAEHFSAFLGLVPSQHSSSDSKHFGTITKTGNSHLRRLLTEAASRYNRGFAGKKSDNLVVLIENGGFEHRSLLRDLPDLFSKHEIGPIQLSVFPLTGAGGAASAPGVEGYMAGAVTKGGSGHIHGGIPHADNCHSITQRLTPGICQIV